MKIQKPIALATASLCVAFTPAAAYSAAQGEVIDEVVVTASHVRTTQLEKHSLIIEGSAIKEGPTRSLGETLDDYAGIASSDYGAAVGQPVIRGLSGDRVKILSNSVPVRDVSGIGADHLNEVDLSNVQQIEIAKGPASLLYASGTAGGIINIVDNAIARSDISETTVRIGAESQTVNDGYSGSLSYSGNISGLNVTYSYNDANYGDFDIPSGAVIHDEDEHHDEEDHEDEHEDEHGDEHGDDTGSLANSDYATRSHKVGVSKTGDWGHIGASYSDIESVFGVPYHGDSHGDEHGHGHEDEDEHGDEHEDEHEDERGDEHEGERIFSNTKSKTYDLDGSFNLDLGPVNKLSFTYRDSDYQHTEQHAEEEGHEDEDEHEGEHEDEHGHEGPTTFTNDSNELRVVVNLDNSVLNQSVVLNLVNEDTSIIGEEAFMNPVDSSETTLGYYVSKDIGDYKLDFGVRVDSIERKGSISATEEHHDEDGHEEEHEDEHEEEAEVTAHSYNADVTSFAASISRDFNEAFNLSAGFARFNRAPSSSELFMNGPHLATGRFEVGSPELRTETHNNFDISLNYEANGYFASLTYFNCSVDDFIYLQDETEEEHDEEHEDDHGGLILANFQQQDADFNGYELELGKTFDLANGTLTLAYARDSVIGELDDGSDVPRIVPVRNIYTASYDSASIEASLRLKDVEKQTRVAATGTPTDGYKMLDFSMTKSFAFADKPSMNVSLFGNNLLNEVARNHTSFVKDEVPLPGRNYGVKFNLEL